MRAETFAERGGPGSLYSPLKEKKGSGPRGNGRTGRGRCSFGSKRGSPARNTLAAKPGGTQVSRAVRTILGVVARWPATALMRASRRRER